MVLDDGFSWDEIGVLLVDDIPGKFLAVDVEVSAIGPNSTDMRDGLMRIMRVGLSDAGYLTSHYGLMCSAPAEAPEFPSQRRGSSPTSAPSRRHTRLSGARARARRRTRRRAP